MLKILLRINRKISETILRPSTLCKGEPWASKSRQKENKYGQMKCCDSPVK